MTQFRSSSFVLCFRSLFASGRGYAFPCDTSGRVDLDELGERARINYLYARAMVGRELGMPVVEAAGPDTGDIEHGRPSTSSFIGRVQPEARELLVDLQLGPLAPWRS